MLPRSRRLLRHRERPRVRVVVAIIPRPSRHREGRRRDTPGGVAWLGGDDSEIAATGVTANSIAIGMIDNHSEPEVTAHMVKAVPVGALGQPEDIAALVVYLASDEAKWMTGQTLQLNGGNVTT